ncbi:MAG: hypothetical protein ACKVT1_02590 [Dehalococcoidia bacterium]
MAVAEDPENSFFGYYDQDEKSFVAMHIGSGNPDEGAWAFAVPGVGLYLATSPATMTDEEDDSITVSFSGTASLDAGATIDSLYGTLYQGSGSSSSVSVTLSGTISANRATGSFSLVHGLATYTAAAEPAPATVAAAISALVDALEIEDFAAVRLLYVSDLLAEITEEEFETDMAAQFGAFGEVISAAEVGSTVYSVNPGDGPQTASVQLAVSFQSGLATPTYTAQLTYLYYENGWRLVDFGRFAEERDQAFFEQPGRAILGQPLHVDPSVLISDPGGEIDVADDSTQVTLSIESGPAGGTVTCTGGLTVAASDGLVQFAGCEFSKVGIYILRAEAAGLADALSQEIEVIAVAGTLIADGDPLTLWAIAAGLSARFSFEAERYGRLRAPHNVYGHPVRDRECRGSGWLQHGQARVRGRRVPSRVQGGRVGHPRRRAIHRQCQGP